VSPESYETLALSITVAASAVSIAYVWTRKPWLKKLRAGLQLAYLWVRGRQGR
jgi:hypothetical protein